MLRHNAGASTSKDGEATSWPGQNRCIRISAVVFQGVSTTAQGKGRLPAFLQHSGEEWKTPSHGKLDRSGLLLPSSLLRVHSTKGLPMQLSNGAGRHFQGPHKRLRLPVDLVLRDAAAALERRQLLPRTSDDP